MKTWFVLALAACGSDHATIDASTSRDAARDAMVDAPRGPDELPCDVRAALDGFCTTCHSSPPNSNAPQALTSRYAFFMDATSVDGRTVGEESANRLTAGNPKPMPPLSEPVAPADQLAALAAWFAAGMPAGTCDAIPAKPAPTTCASNMFWTQGDTGSELMQPGKPCRACHQLEATDVEYYFAGSAFPAFHEQDLCNSPPPAGARIEILDTTGAVTLTLDPDAVGNFTSTSSSAGVSLPYTARLVANGRTRAMTTQQTSGDCDGCHTEQGTHVAPATVDAPGRLVWP